MVLQVLLYAPDKMSQKATHLALIRLNQSRTQIPLAHFMSPIAHQLNAILSPSEALTIGDFLCVRA
jgi:hypothetical protein